MTDVPDLTDEEFDEACLRLAMGNGPAIAPLMRIVPDPGRRSDAETDDRLLLERRGPRADAVRQLRDEQARAQRRFAESSTELEPPRTEPKQMVNFREEYREREESVKDSVAAAEARAAEFAQALAARDDELAMLRGRAERAEAAALRLATEHDDLRERLAQREDDLARRDDQLGQIQGLAEERVAGLRGQVTLLKEQAEGHKLDVDVVAEDISRRDLEIRNLREEVARLRIVAGADELAAARTRETQLLDAIAERDKELMELREDLIEREQRHAVEITSIIEQFTQTSS